MRPYPNWSNPLKLTRKAYPTADPTIISILALNQFIDALPDPEMRLRLRKAKPRDINEAEILAIRLETYRLADAQRVKTVHEITSNEIHHISSLNQDNQNLREDLQSLPQKIRALIRNGQKSTQNFAQNPHASYPNQGSYKNPYRPNTQTKNPQIMDLNRRVHPTKETITMGAITPLTPNLSNLKDRETTQCRIRGSEVGSFKGQAPTPAIKYGSTSPT